MTGLNRLIAGELKRLVRYKIPPVSWSLGCFDRVVFACFGGRGAEWHLCFSLLMCGDVHLAVKCFLPLGKAGGNYPDYDGDACVPGQILASKIVASLVLALESVAITSLALFLIHGLTFNYGLLLLFIVVGGVAHTAIGFVLSLWSRDFTAMLGLLLCYMFLFTVPSILHSFGVIDAKYRWLLMISPSHAANFLVASAVRGELELPMIIVGSLYLGILAAVLFRFVVGPRFKDNAVRGVS